MLAMTTATISKKITKGEELVVMPRRAYEALERAYAELLWRQKELEADADIRAGRVSKGYRTVPALKRALAQMSKKPTLKTALANFTPDMIELVNWGPDVGKEVIAYGLACN